VQLNDEEVSGERMNCSAFIDEGGGKASPCWPRIS